MDKIINVVFITDENYVLPTLTALLSLKLNSTSRVNAFVITENISQNSVNSINAISDKNFNVILKRIENPYEYVNTTHIHVSKAAMIKFALPNLFPEFNRILYLDSDILVEKDLTQLYDASLEDVYAAAVVDMQGQVGESLHVYLGLEKYMNSGVMLLNLEKMRNENISDKLLEAKLHDERKKFMDQDAFNQVFAGKINWQSLKFNFMKPNISKYSIEEIADFYGCSLSEMKEIVRNPYVNHLTSSIKPWKTCEAVNFKHWYSYFKKLPDCSVKFDAQNFLSESFKCYKILKLKKFMQWIFSLRNQENHKSILILGIKIKIKRKSISKINT